MFERLENIVSQRVDGKHEGTIALPESVTRIQFVIDRQPLEDHTSPDEESFGVQIYDLDDNYLGGCWWFGGRVEELGPRPGQRMLWAFAYWNVPKGLKRVRYVLSTIKDLQLNVDVDVFIGDQ